MSGTPGTQRGFSLVAAVFLLVVLAALGAYAVRLNTLQQQSVTAALRGSQALEAARAGASWAAYRSINAGACMGGTLNLTQGASAGFRVTVQCTQSSHDEGATTLRVFVLEARAEAGTYGRPDYVSRRLQTKVTDAV